MKNIFLYIIGFILSSHATFADGGILGDFETSSDSTTEETLKKGEVHIEDIPVIITNAIDFLMGIAGTISIIFIIVGAYKILFGSLEQDKTKGKDTIIMAIFGFAIASLAWFIIRVLLNNLGA